jgi:diguanylate cyclase (GGDEF)-like protein
MTVALEAVADSDLPKVLPKLTARAHVIETIDMALRQSLNTSKPVGFALVSIEHFDVINTAFGFSCGDTLLGEVHDKLMLVVRADDVLHRFSGSKFAVVMRDCSPAQLLTACTRFRNAIRDTLFQTDAGPVTVTVAVSGVALPAQATNGQDAVAHAQVALEDARKDRRRGLALYRHDASRDKRRIADAQLAQNVVAAIAENRMQLAFQPVVCAASGQLAFHEALIRLVDGEGGLREAGSFIAAAERLGLIRMVDNRALDLALDQLLRFENAVLSVNVSNETVSDPQWLRRLQTATDAQNGLAERLIVEITESQAVTDPEQVRAFLEAVRALGCRIAIDDFGAGYTAFQNLKTMPFDILKVDGSFAVNLLRDERNQVFIKALVSISKCFGAKTVVEWVDDMETASVLDEWGVDYLQGFGIASPMPVADYSALPRKSVVHSIERLPVRKRAAG